MLTDKQRRLIAANMAQNLVKWKLKSEVSMTVTMYNDHVREHPEEGLTPVDAITPEESKELIVLALKAALKELEG